MLGKSLVGIRTLVIRLLCQRFDHWAKGSTHRKKVEKLGFYTFLSVVSGVVSGVTKVTFFLLILFYFMFFAVNNKVETRREEPGYEFGQNLNLFLLFDDFGRFLRFF